MSHRQPSPRNSAALVGLLALCGTLSAQQLHRVGAGQAHATISSAIAAASSGDLVLVDPGTYAPFDINGKGLSVLAATRPFAVQPAATRPVIRVTNIGVGQSVTVSGWFTSISFGGAPPLEIRSCRGSVRIHQATLSPVANLTAVPMRSIIDIVDAQSVWLASVDCWPASPHSATTANPVPANNGLDDGVAAITVERSQVLVQGCRLRGYDNLGTPSAGRWGGDALRLLGASVARLHASANGPTNLLQGGLGGRFGGSAVQLLAPQPREDVKICGPTLLTKGPGPLSGGMFSVNHDRGIVQSGYLTIERFVPACLQKSVGAVSSATRVSIGSSHTFTVDSFFPRPYAMFLGPTLLRSVVLPGVQNTALLNYFSPLTFSLRVGVLPAASTSTTITVPIPNAPALIGVQLATQAVLGPPTSSTTPAFSFTLGELLVVV